ncbi:MAG: hypothetical protein ACPL09_02975 [Candidatus Methanodesulfokora sp.]
MSSERIKKIKKSLDEEIRPSLYYALERDPDLASRIITRVFGEMLELIAEIDQNLSKRIDEVNQILSKRIEELTNNVNKLTDTVRSMSKEMGKLSKRYATLREIELRETLERLCFSLGFRVDRGVIVPGKPSVDAIITGRGITALVEIAMKGNSGDLRQLIKTSDLYEEFYGIKPAFLFLLSVEKPDDITFKRAKEKGVIVTMRPGEIAELLDKKALNKGSPSPPWI